MAKHVFLSVKLQMETGDGMAGIHPWILFSETGSSCCQSVGSGEVVNVLASYSSQARGPRATVGVAPSNARAHTHTHRAICHCNLRRLHAVPNGRTNGCFCASFGYALLVPSHFLQICCALAVLYLPNNKWKCQRCAPI